MDSSGSGYGAHTPKFVKETTLFMLLSLLSLLLSYNNAFPTTGQMNIEANSRNCNDIRVSVIVFLRGICIGAIIY
jgi:hypothetical protein